MKRPSSHSKVLKYLAQIFRLIIGVVFIASGFLKAVDPWGTAVKFGEYFSLYGLSFLKPLSNILAIWLCGAELMMGCMMLFRVRTRLISIFAMLSMTLFTIISILSVSVLPMEECGCFGDAVALNSWQTLWKNLIILPMVITVWYRYRPDNIFAFNVREVILTFVFFFGAVGFSAYNFIHLPVLDLLPYKVGVNVLGGEASEAEGNDYAVVLVYRNKQSGELREFSLSDTEWQDESQWEWVETKSESDNIEFNPANEFKLTCSDGSDYLDRFVDTPEMLHIICITDLDNISEGCLKRLNKYVEQSQGSFDDYIVATPQRIKEPNFIFDGKYPVEIVNIDATLLKTILRAKSGVIDIKDGAIYSKRSCYDILDAEPQPSEAK